MSDNAFWAALVIVNLFGIALADNERVRALAQVSAIFCFIIFYGLERGGA